VVQEEELVLTVYRVPFSTNVERIALAAGHKKIRIDWVDVDPDDRSPVEAISGQSLVPVLVHGDEVITDSPRILDWLEERAPEPPLYPREPALRATATVFAQWFNHVWKVAPNRLVDGPDPALSAEIRASVGLFEGLLECRDYLFGEFGIADVIAFPFLKYAALGLPDQDTDPFHAILVDNLPLADDSPLRAWTERVDARPRG
jgi:glutathione S-transferase